MTMPDTIAGRRDACRPKPFYFLTTTDEKALAPHAVREAMLDLKATGYGGCVLFNKPPDGFTREAYLGEAWFRTIRTFVEAARDLGLEIWVNDGFDFPPGSAGGRVEAIAPHLRQQRLVLEEGRAVAVDVPWGFPAFEEPESSRLFIELVYETYRRELGDLFGHGITGFFSDADNRRMPHGALAETYFPWAPGFAAAFERAHGYSVEPHLPGILRGETSQAAVDYWRLAGRLYQQWFAANHDWCRRHGLKYSFHTSDTGPYTTGEILRSSIFNEGDAFELHAHADLPGTDHELRTLNGGTPCFPATLWHRETARWGEPADCRSPAFDSVYGDVRAKLAASAAFLHQREGALCECFAASNWSVEPDELRRIGVWQIMQGITMLVPHAVHHRFHGTTKYFAPPELFRNGALRDAIRALNDHLAELCAIASAGQLLAPVALLDPTEEIWRTGRPCPRFFELCVELNRRPQGYVIAPLAMVIEQASRFRAVVNPGLPLAADAVERLDAAGIAVLGPEELDRLDAAVPVDAGYAGKGRPHFMRRRVAEGELLLVANVEDAEEITGEVHYGGGTCPVALAPGEVAAFAPGWRRCRTPLPAPTWRQPLPAEARVTWSAPNSITLFRWEDAAGEVLDQVTAGEAQILCFRWQNQEELPPLTLLAPADYARSVTLDGRPVSQSQPRMLHDDPYLAFDLAASGSPGDHMLALQVSRYCWTSPCYLIGEFDCRIEAENGSVPGFGYYNFALQLPARATVCLSRRRQRLDLRRSWAEQGHPFYSGAATYRLELGIPREISRAVLHLGRVHGQASLRIDGVSFGNRPFPPFVFDLTGKTGTCHADLTVENTPGNRYDGYAVASGVAAIPELRGW